MEKLYLCSKGRGGAGEGEKFSNKRDWLLAGRENCTYDRVDVGACACKCVVSVCVRGPFVRLLMLPTFKYTGCPARMALLFNHTYGR